MKRFSILVAIFGGVGALLGFAYYYYIGCYSGSCPIGSNPYISTIYGGVMGIALGWAVKNDSEKKKAESK